MSQTRLDKLVKEDAFFWQNLSALALQSIAVNIRNGADEFLDRPINDVDIAFM